MSRLSGLRFINIIQGADTEKKSLKRLKTFFYIYLSGTPRLVTAKKCSPNHFVGRVVVAFGVAVAVARSYVEFSGSTLPEIMHV